MSAIMLVYLHSVRSSASAPAPPTTAVVVVAQIRVVRPSIPPVRGNVGYAVVASKIEEKKQ